MLKIKSQPKARKSKTVAALLAIFLGDLGIHKFYLGKVEWGLIYIFFSWTWIPMVTGIIEGIIYFTMPDKDFHEKYS